MIFVLGLFWWSALTQSKKFGNNFKWCRLCYWVIVRMTSVGSIWDRSASVLMTFVKLLTFHLTNLTPVVKSQRSAGKTWLTASCYKGLVRVDHQFLQQIYIQLEFIKYKPSRGDCFRSVFSKTVCRPLMTLLAVFSDSRRSYKALLTQVMNFPRGFNCRTLGCCLVGSCSTELSLTYGAWFS